MTREEIHGLIHHEVRLRLRWLRIKWFVSGWITYGVVGEVIDWLR